MATAASTFGDTPLPAGGASSFGDAPDTPPPSAAPTDTWATYLPHTSSKLAHNLNLQNTLDAVGEVDDKLGRGDYSGAWESTKDLIPGILRAPWDTLHAVYQKVQDGDYSGATADLLTHAMVLHGGVEGLKGITPDAVRATVADSVANVKDATATAAKGAARGVIEANKNVPAHAAAVAAGTLIPDVGHTIGAGIEAGNTLYGAVKGARSALATRAAQQASAAAAAASDTAVAEQRANPQPSLAQQQYGKEIQPGGPPPIPTVEPIAPDAQALAAQRVARQAANAPGAATAASTFGDTPVVAGDTPPAVSSVLLDQIAKGFGAKSYAKMGDPTQPGKLTAAQEVVQRVAKQVVADEAAKAAAPVPAAVPGVSPAEGAPPTPSASGPAIPASPVAQALVPAPQSGVSPQVEAPSGGAVPASLQPTAPAAPEPAPAVPEPVPVRPTEHVPLGRVEYYPTNAAAHIPTPGELGHGRYVPEDTPLDSSTLSHIRAENEKGYNAAHFAFSNGISDPAFFDQLTEAEKRDFMNGTEEDPGALQHGREVDNPTPKTKYQANRETGSILDGNTLRLAKAHLEKMVADEAAAPAPGQSPTLPAAGQPAAAGAVSKTLDLIANGGKQSSEWLRQNGIFDGSSASANRLLDPEVLYHLSRSVAGDVARGVISAKDAAAQVADQLSRTYGEVVQPKLAQIRQAIEGHLNDYTKLLPASAGEPVSPLRGMFPDVSAPGAQKLTAAADYLRRKAGREDAGTPENDRTVLRDQNGTFAVGKITPQDWVNRVQDTLSPDELTKSRAWYSDLQSFFASHFGEEAAPRHALAWLLGNQNTSPSGAMLNVLRGADKLAGKEMTKTAGLAEDKILQSLAGEPVTGGVGAKLSDFVDSALQKTSRTFMGDDPRGGSPAVIDVWANRDVGKVDAPLAAYLTKRFGAKAAPLAMDGNNIGETDYEYGSQFYNDLTKRLNSTGFDGGKWTPAEAQAAGWVAMQKAMGKTPEFPEDIIDKNSRRVSIGLDLGQGAPLRQEGITTIPREQANWMVDRAAELSGVKVLERHYGTGADLSKTEPSVHIRALGSPEAIQDFMDAVGHLGQQTEVIGARPLKSGNRTAVDIIQRTGDDLSNDAARVQFHQDLIKAGAPENMVQGFQPTVVDGRPGLRFINSEGNWNAKQIAALTKAADKAAQASGYTVDLSDGKIELLSTGNDWSKNPDGRSYLQGLVDRGRLQEAHVLGDQLRPAFAERLRGAQAGDRGSAAQGGLENRPQAAPATTKTGRNQLSGAVIERAADTVKRLRKQAQSP